MKKPYVIITLLTAALTSILMTAYVTIPGKISEKDKKRAHIILANDDDRCTETAEGLKYDCKGYFAREKLLENTKQVEFLIYTQDGQWTACHDAGIILIKDYSSIIDKIETFNSGNDDLEINFQEYKCDGTKAIVLKNKSEKQETRTAYLSVYKLNGSNEFVSVYNKSIQAPNSGIKEGSPKIEITATACDKDGYRQFIIKKLIEYQLPFGKGPLRMTDEIETVSFRDDDKK
jgi:hypothetical protein